MCTRSPGARRHKVNCKRPALAVGRIRRGTVQGLAVVKCDAAGRQVAHDRLAVVDQLAHVEEDIAALGLVVGHGAQVRAGDELHGSIVQVDVVESEPATDQIGRQAFPVSVILVPEDRPAMVRRFVKRLIVKQLYIGADKVFDDVEDAFMVGQLVELKVVLGDLHELEHLLLVSLVMIVIIFGNCQVADGPLAAAFKGKFIVIFAAHLFDEFVLEYFADNQEAVFPEAGDLCLCQGFVAAFVLRDFSCLHQ